MSDLDVLSYLLARPEAAGVVFRRPAFVLLVLLVPLLLRPGKIPLPAVVLRMLAALPLIAVLAGMQVTARLPAQDLTLAVAVDRSLSIAEEARGWISLLLEEVHQRLAPGDRLALISFAGDVRLITIPGDGMLPDRVESPSDTGRTNIAAAIDAARSLLPEQGARHILLITDGNENEGHARRLLPALLREGTRVSVSVPPTKPGPDVVLDKLVVPPVVTEGRPFPFRLVVYNAGRERPALLQLYYDDRIIESAPVSLIEGLNALELTYRLFGRGSHQLRVELETPDDTAPENNVAVAAVNVRGAPRVLYVAEEPSTIATVLEERDLGLIVREPRDFPEEMRELLHYPCVVLESPTAAAMPPEAFERLQHYVDRFGGGLVVIGGGETFGDPALRETALASVLPVTLEPRRPGPRKREPLALFLLIDRSNSMGYNSRVRTLRDGEKLRYARKAALAVVRQLKDADYLGVIAFDSQAHPIAPLRPLGENRALLERNIPRLVENGGTDFYDALLLARDQLESSRVSRRHIILLTDGDTNRAAADHYPLLVDLVRAGISVTTIRIGDDDVNLKLLRDISERTGGQFHHVRDVVRLPDLMLRDTTRALAPASGEGQEYFPARGASSQILDEISVEKMPPLRGYAFARLRPGGDAVLQVQRLDRGDPLLAVWRYGLGRVAAFTASPRGDAGEWPAWAGYTKLWSQIVQWTMRERSAVEPLLQVRRTGPQAELSIVLSAGNRARPVRALLQRSDGAPITLELNPGGLRRWVSALPELDPGQYPISLILDGPNGEEAHVEMISIPRHSTPHREELRRREPDLDLLGELTRSTGGMLNPPVADLLERELGQRVARQSLDFVLVPLCLVLLIADIAMRRLRPPG